MTTIGIVLITYFGIGIIVWIIGFRKHMTSGFWDGASCFIHVVPFWFVWIFIFIKEKLYKDKPCDGKF